jgi:iron complex transport system permease protein
MEKKMDGMEAVKSAIRARRDWKVIAAMGLLLWAAVFAFSLRVGMAGEIDWDVVKELRLPRVVLATAVGMGLSVAGAVLQAVFTNPLCEPYTLGVSSGSALGAVIGAWLGLPLVVAGLTGSAFLGALAFGFLLYLISLRSGKESRFRLLLSGVMLGFFGSSLVAVVMALSDPSGLQGALFWLLGDLSRARPEGAWAALALIVSMTVFILTRWRGLDALLVGEENALALGVDVSRVRRSLLLISSLLIGVCVSAGGMIGFIGLVIPHLARQAVGSLHRKMIPVCAVFGALGLTAADTLARTVAAPFELPVGVVTALIGAPVFLWILLRRRGTA